MNGTSAVVAIHRNQVKPEEGPQDELGVVPDPSAVASMLPDITRAFTTSSTPEAKAAARIQRIVRLNQAKGKTYLKRKGLVERLIVEQEMFQGSLTIILNLCLFFFLIGALSAENGNPLKSGLRKLYEESFDLARTGEIHTITDLKHFLRDLSQRSRDFQILSSNYFSESEGEIKFLSGLKEFRRPAVVEDPDVVPRIDSPAITFTAWVRQTAGKQGYIIRKPVSPSDPAEKLVCWGWSVTADGNYEFEFGGHDFGGTEPSNGLLQESVAASASTPAHLMGATDLKLAAVILNATAASFFTNAELVDVVPLSRPVTDCWVDVVEVGSDGFQVGELTFYARELSVVEMQEISSDGFPFEAIAEGRKPFVSAQTSIEKLSASQSSEFAAASANRDQFLTTTQTDFTLGRAHVETVVGGTQTQTYPALESLIAPATSCGTTWPTCHVIRGVNETLTSDSQINRDYYDLLPGTGAQKVWVDRDAVGEFYHYDVESFPIWKGQSVSFSVWIKQQDPWAYILSKHNNKLVSSRCWTVFSGNDQWATFGGNNVNGFAHPSMRVYTPDNEVVFTNMRSWRHVAFILDKETNGVRAYLDGVLFGQAVFDDANTVANLDCDNNPDTYIGFGHRAPGAASTSFIGGIQDFRMYIGAPLTADDVKALAQTSTEALARKECKNSGEVADSRWRDVSGHDCAWYQGRRQHVPDICQSPEVKRECSIACDSDDLCFEEPRSVAVSDQIWNRVMLMEAPSPTEYKGFMCVREGLDVVSQCETRLSNRDPLSYPPLDSKYYTSSKYFHYRLTNHVPGRVPNVTDCRLLKSIINPTCSFDPIANLDASIVATKEFTVTFWIKVASSKSLLDGSFQPAISFWSGVSPPELLFEVLGTKNEMELDFFARCDDEGEGAFSGVSVSLDRWIHISVLIGDVNGQRMIGLMHDSSFDQDAVLWDWCPSMSGDFIQAVSVSQADSILMSPIEIKGQAATRKLLQEQYYEQKSNWDKREGPRRADTFRLNERISYESTKYDHPAVLIAPPILSQERSTSSSSCENDFASGFLNGVWERSITGLTCSKPYSCDTALLNSSQELKSCPGSGKLQSYFGKAPLRRKGKDTFTEFLVSITEAPFLVRSGMLLPTEDFINDLTTRLESILVMFNPKHSITSTIEISAKIDTSVIASYSIRHFQPVDNSSLQEYRTFAVLGFVVIVAMLLWIFSLARAGGASIRFLLLDVTTTILALCYLTIKLVENEDSAGLLVETTGQLNSVPWGSKEISVDDKMSSFFESLKKLEDKIQAEGSFSLFSFVVTFVVLIRIILATAAHPRTAILVSTLGNAADDLWHFLLLLAILFMGFCFVGTNAFGDFRPEFESVSTTLETLFSMMIGEVPVDYGGDTLLTVYVICFSVLVFFLMLNFVIAIIVEAYLKVKTLVEENEAENEFFTDFIASFYVTFRAQVLRWPGRSELIYKLSRFAKTNIGRSQLKFLWPDWDVRSIDHFMELYSQYEFMHPKTNSAQAKSADVGVLLQDSVKELTQTMAALMDRQVPSKAEVILHNKLAKARRTSLSAMQGLSASAHTRPAKELPPVAPVVQPATVAVATAAAPVPQNGENGGGPAELLQEIES